MKKTNKLKHLVIVSITFNIYKIKEIGNEWVN